MADLGVTYSVTTNIGDEIQQVALLETLSLLGVTPTFEVNRDTLRPREPNLPEGASLIVCGWLAERRSTIESIAPELSQSYARHSAPGLTYFDPTFLDAAAVRVMYMGVHLIPELVDDIRANEALHAHLLRHAPVGARDHETVRRLATLGIPSWFSGCITLQLTRPRQEPTIDRLLVDAPGEGLHVSQDIIEPMIDRPERVIARRQLARDRISELARARLVVTNRLHAALPCLALGTEVEFADPRWVKDCDRFSGLLDLDAQRIAELKGEQIRHLRAFLELPC